MADDRGSGDLGTIIIAGAIGAAVGAVVALMLAPKPGVELRADLGEKAKEYADKAKEKASEVATMAKEKAAEMREQCCSSEDDASAESAEAEA